MTGDLDSVARYAAALKLDVCPRTVLVEGTSDAALFRLAAESELRVHGRRLLGSDMTIVAAGEGDRGGAEGIVRELVTLRGMARTCLLPNGRPRYRFVALFDNDNAGRRALALARHVDKAILEFKDIYLLHPVMPVPGSLDPSDIQRTFGRHNEPYKGLDWEIEDLIPDHFTEEFCRENPWAVRRVTPCADRVHRDLTSDGKARFHRFVKMNAVHDDLQGVIQVLEALRCYLGVRPTESD
jgi:hypothetical protein